MMFIVRPLVGYLQLVESIDGENGEALTYAIPDAKFWTWLASSGNEAKLEAENPERMERVRKNGVGVLHTNKQVLINSGFDTLAETETKRPPPDMGTGERPVLITAKAVV